MKLEIVINKFLIEVVKQLDSMRSTYRRSHQYEIPVGNPIEKNIKKISNQLEKFNRNVLNGKTKDSLDEVKNKRISPLIGRCRGRVYRKEMWR